MRLLLNGFLPLRAIALVFTLGVFSGPVLADTGANQLHSKLVRALQAGDLPKATIALEDGANPNSPLADGSLPLAWAVDAQNISLVRLLLARGAKPNLETSESKSV